MTNYWSLQNPWTAIGFYLHKMALLKCSVSLIERFYEIHAQHILMVIGRKLNMYNIWSRLFSYSDGYIELFF